MNSNVITAHAKSTVTRKLLAIIVLAILCAWPARTAWAKDTLAVSVTNATGSPVVVNNGQAVGTIQVFYTVNANAFTLGEFASFDLDWVTVLSTSSKNATVYGPGIEFALSQDQNGGYVDVVPAPATFNLTAAGQHDTSRITVFITADKDGNLPPSADGTDLVGNLKLDAGQQVGSVTNIQVHIRLVHATNCLKVYNFVTDQDFNLGILDTTSLTVQKSGPKAGTVNSTQPGQFSDNILVANTCATAQSFDLEIGLDSSFAVKPNGNPVKTYTAVGQFDSSNFETIMAGTATNYQSNLCLPNVTVPAGATLLATVHSETKGGLLAAALPADQSFDFVASVHQNANSACTGPLDPLASPNPATFTLPFTIK